MPERGRFRAVAREINQIKRCLLALRPMPGGGTKVRATSIGVAIDARPSVTQTSSQSTGEATWL